MTLQSTPQKEIGRSEIRRPGWPTWIGNDFVTEILLEKCHGLVSYMTRCPILLKPLLGEVSATTEELWDEKIGNFEKF